MKKLYLISCLATVLFSFNSGYVHAQEEYNFLPEKDGYIDEANRFFEKYSTPKGKDILKEFTSYINNTELEENEWIAIAEISNIIAGRQSNLYTYMSGFIEALTSFKFNPDRLRNFPVWSQQVSIILRQNSRKLEPLLNFFEFTSNLHYEKILFKSANLIWKISTEEYTFINDGDFFVRTGNTDLTSVAGRDSSRIQSTNGDFYTSNNYWSANGGKISWENVGIDNNLVFVSLSKYQLDLSKSVYTIDSVDLIDRRNFDYPILGKLENKISIGVRPERSGYPTFYSYKDDYRIKSIFPNMDYKGGYSLEGLKIIGSGIGKNKGELLVFEDNKPVMQLNSQRYVFDDEGAKGLNTETRIYLETDSIIHPGLFFQYKRAKNELVLMRDGSGSSKSKFFDSYHQMTLDVEMFKWFPGDSLLYLSGMVGTLKNNASFESADFFSIQWFNEIQLADKKNPLILVKQCADHHNSRFFYSYDLAAFMNKPIYLVEEMVFNVSYLGFLRFDPETKLIQVLQRTYDFLDQHAGLLDYDIIKFKSINEPPNPNAVISLRTGVMTVMGVPEVELSLSRYVRFQPTDQTVRIEKGRNMKFGGVVEAGLLTFTGSEFDFTYEDYLLNLKKVDNIRLEVHIPLVKDYKETRIANISSIIENTQGILQIDAPNNKAGLEPEATPQFPFFRFDTTAYVYYDQKYIQNGAYTRDSFFFEIGPNTLLGLNDVRFREKLFFPGTFFTYNIFPPLKLDLAYRDDNSLGFDTFMTPDEGYPVYRGQGTFYNEISMSNSGLRGNGTLTYLGSTIESENFLFLPDRALIAVDNVIVDQNSSTFGNPEIIGHNLTATWMPGDKSLMFEHLDEPLTLYGIGEFTGKIFIEPESVRGSGRLVMDGYTTVSDDFTFMNERFEMNDGQLKIHSSLQDGQGNITSQEENDFIANHVSGSVDLKNRMAEFASTGEKDGELLFPVNKFKADENSFIWDMERNIVSFGQNELISTKTEQKGLSFEAGQSVFDLNSYTITADSVKWIDVADVRIFPYNSQALIRANAAIDSMPGSRVISRDTSLRHEFRSSVIKINGKDNYSGSGYYIYKDIAGQELPLPFEEIGAQSGKPSEGKARVDSLSPFLLSPEFEFIGAVNWINNNELLSFKGSYRLTHDCPDVSKKWVRLNSEINPDNVIIAVDSISRSYEGETLRHGFYLSNQPIEMYSTFFGPLLNYTDHPVISTYGQISYNYETGKYVIQRPELMDSVFPGPALSFDKNGCYTSASGQLDLGLDLGQLKISTTGTIQQDLVTDSIKLNQIMAIDFFLDQKLLDILTNSINNRVGMMPVDYTREEYKTTVIDWLGRQRGQELLNELNLIGSFKKIPEEFEHTLLLTDLKMKWNPERGSYESVGKIGIGNIYGESVNKLVKGNLELVKRRGGDTFTLYIEFDTNSYFFFYYNRGLMQVMAGPTNEDFNNRVRALKPKKRRLKVKSGPRYEFTLGQYRLIRTFLDNINSN